MPSVSVSQLKANLSRYLRAVRRGSEIEILDRGVPVARLVSAERAPGADPGRWRRLVEAGLLRPGTGDASSILQQPPLRLEADLGGAVQEDREEGA